ncbi:MAG: DoxX family protein [Chloroflexi bacterium]|nr:DoxX family protein [Chloroflexota bacterium]
MEALFLMGRIILGLYFLYNGFNHFRMRAGMVAYAKTMGTPAAELAVPVTGLMLLFGGATLLLGAWLAAGAIVLIIFLVPVAFMMHKFWGVADPMMAANQQAHFLKNIALAASLLAILALDSLLEGGTPLSLIS